MKNKKIVLLTVTALFTALITVATMVIQIPVGKGYLHFGDSVIYLAACILPAPCALFAASVGAALADLFTGYAVYAPATFIIKALNVLPFILMRVYLKRKGKDDKIFNWQICLMLVPTTLVTLLGYYVADSIIAGSEVALVSAITSGWIQPAGSLVVFTVLAIALDKAQLKNKLFKQMV